MYGRTVFISYANRDHGTADRVRHALEATRIGVWLAPEDVTPETPSWERAIREAIATVDGVVLIATEQACASHYVRAELELAGQAGRTIYPLWAQGTNWLDCVPFGFSGLQYYDIRADRFDAGIQKLVDTLEGKVGPQERIGRNDREYKRKMQGDERARIFGALRDHVKAAWSDGSLSWQQKVVAISDAGAAYLADMSAFEKKWGDELLPAENPVGKHITVAIVEIQRAVRDKESGWLARSASVVKHLSHLVVALDHHWETSKGQTVEGSIVKPKAIDSPEDE